MQWPSELQTLSLDQLSDRVSRLMAHWGFCDFRVQVMGDKPQYMRNFHWDGNRITVAGALFQASTALSTVPYIPPERYARGLIHRLASESFMAPSDLAALVREMLVRADSAIFAGIPKGVRTTKAHEAPLCFAWGGILQNAIGLGILGATRIHASYCPACRYVQEIIEQEATESQENTEDESEFDEEM